jgi:hypothetical protein
MSSLNSTPVVVVINGQPFAVNIELNGESVIMAYAKFSNVFEKHKKVLEKIVRFGKNGKKNIDWDKYTQIINGVDSLEKLEIAYLVGFFEERS